MTDVELLTALLGRSQEALCARLKATYGPLRSIARVHPADLRETGLTRAGVERLTAIFEIARRFGEIQFRSRRGFQGFLRRLRPGLPRWVARRSPRHAGRRMPRRWRSPLSTSAPPAASRTLVKHSPFNSLATNERLEARPWVVRTRRGRAAIFLDRDAPGDRERAAEIIAAGRAEAEQLGMARELVRFERLTQHLESA